MRNPAESATVAGQHQRDSPSLGINFIQGVKVPFQPPLVIPPCPLSTFSYAPHASFQQLAVKPDHVRLQTFLVHRVAANFAGDRSAQIRNRLPRNRMTSRPLRLVEFTPLLPTLRFLTNTK